MPAPLPRRKRLGAHVAFLPEPSSAFPFMQEGRLPHCTFRGLLSVHSRSGLHVRKTAQRSPLSPECFSPCCCLHEPLRLLPTESDNCWVGFAPTGKTRLSTAHCKPLLSPAAPTEFTCGWELRVRFMRSAGHRTLRPLQQVVVWHVRSPDNSRIHRPFSVQPVVSVRSGATARLWLLAMRSPVKGSSYVQLLV